LRFRGSNTNGGKKEGKTPIFLSHMPQLQGGKALSRKGDGGRHEHCPTKEERGRGCFQAILKERKTQVGIAIANTAPEWGGKGLRGS